MVREQPSNLSFVSLCLISSELNFPNINSPILENKFTLDVQQDSFSSSTAKENAHLCHALCVGGKCCEERWSCGYVLANTLKS